MPESGEAAPRPLLPALQFLDAATEALSRDRLNYSSDETTVDGSGVPPPPPPLLQAPAIPPSGSATASPHGTVLGPLLFTDSGGGGGLCCDLGATLMAVMTDSKGSWALDNWITTVLLHSCFRDTPPAAQSVIVGPRLSLSLTVLSPEQRDVLLRLRTWPRSQSLDRPASQSVHRPMQTMHFRCGNLWAVCRRI